MSIDPQTIKRLEQNTIELKISLEKLIKLLSKK